MNDEASPIHDAAATLRKSLFERAMDGCHRYGWIISIVVYIVSFAYFMGGLNQQVANLKEQIGGGIDRIDRIESILLEKR